MRCDYYAATINDNKNNIMRNSIIEFGGQIRKLPKGRFGYTSSYVLEKEKNTLLTILSDGNNGANPNCFASGDNAQNWFNFCRGNWMDSHKVSRIDVCEDLIQEGLFDQLTEKMVALAEKKGLKVSTVGDWLTEGNEDGRTLYIGSQTSKVRLRIYEKGKQLRVIWKKTGFAPPKEFDKNWVRVECQVRPEKSQRITASKDELHKFWGYSQWLQEAGKECLGLEVERFSSEKIIKQPDDYTWHWLVRNYGAFIEKQAELLGGYPSVAQKLEELINHRQHNLALRKKSDLDEQ